MDIDKAFEELYEGWKKGKYKVTDGKTGKVLATFNSGGKAQKYVDDIFKKEIMNPLLWNWMKKLRKNLQNL